MKKSTLFVLLLAAVLLFMTACNPATQEPAATDDPTSIPGVTEDPTSIPGVKEDTNVPSKDKLVAATPDDIKNIINALRFDITSYSSMTDISSQAYKYTIKEGATIDIFNGTSTENVAISGTITEDYNSDHSEEKIEQGTKYSSTSGSKYNGSLTVGDVVYNMKDFVVKNISNTDPSNSENPHSYSFEYEGTVTKDGEDITENKDKKDCYDIISNCIHNNNVEKNVNGSMSQTTSFVYSAETLSGNVSMKVSLDGSTATAVLIADFSKINGHKMTTKFIASLYNDGSNIPVIKEKRFEYASFDGTYYTSDSLVSADALVNLIVGLLSKKPVNS